MRRLVPILALAVVHSIPAYGEVDLTVAPTREIPDGKLDYTPVADVSPQSGDYAPRIPLEVLPGPAGQAPAIELVYSAKRANGPLGAGWGLSFESAVERKSKFGGLAEMTAEDTFWIDGEKLVAMPDGTYRTEQDDFTIYAKTELSGQLIGWTALKDSFARHYGIRNTLSSLLADVNAVEYRDETESAGVIQGTEQVRWLLSATVSPFGVEVAYRYTVHELPPFGRSALRHLPDKIIYGVSGSSSNEIEFGYAARDDVRVSYANGPKRTEGKLLRRIVVKRIDGATTTSHYYVLDYQAAEHSPQSLLSEVKRLEIADPAAPPTVTSESSTQAESLARFVYQDSETEWGERKAITLVGDPALDVPGGRQYFSLPMTGDVNGDARPDLIVFNDICLLKSGPDPDPRGDLDPSPIHYYECEPDHRVYLNTIRESRLSPSGRVVGPVDRSSSTPVNLRREQVLVYDRGLSRQVTDFYEALHDLFLNAQPTAIEDLNKDGFVELIKNGKFAPGGPDGWDSQGIVIGWASLLEDYQFADINGDGNADLVSQSRYYPNTGASPYFTASRAIVDPVTAGNASEQYNRARARCLDSGDSGIYLRSDFGVNGLGLRSSDPAQGESISADDWVWRHTTHPDLNGDGLADRVISFPFLHYETRVESPDSWQMWVRRDAECGVFDQVFLGDGRGGFEAAGYGIGGPMQREQTFAQTRTLDDDGIDDHERDSYEFRYHLNHFALGDVDADGRNEIAQFCANDTRFLALSDQGVGRWGLNGWEGYGPGYDISADSGSCPQQFTAPVPEEFFGLSMLDYHYSTILDFDGDGMADLFQYSHPYGDPHIEVSNDGTPWEDWQDGPHWRRNQRGTAQNHLVSITWPHGASTRVAWAWSAEDPDNSFAINVEHVKSLEDARGEHRFSFTGGAFGDGQFLGFGRVETLQPRGATLVQTFFNSRMLRNKPSTEELYDEGGRLKNLRVHVPGSDRPNAGTLDGLLLLDGIVPYYNPLQRVCEFEFGAFNGSVQLGADIDSYIARCEAFEDEEGLVATEVFDQRSLFSVLRGGDPLTLASTLAEQRELAALRSMLRGEPPDRICVSVTSDALRATPPVICDRSPTVPRDRVGRQTPAPHAAAAVSWSAAPYRTRWDLADPATELPDWGPVVVETTDERMFVTEYDYDDDIGHVVEQRELRDASKTTDSLIREYAYSTWDPAYGGARLLHETTRNRQGTIYENIDYQNFVNGQWRTRVEHETVSGATRSDRRTFTALGEIESSTDALGRTTRYVQGDCGITTRVTDPLGYTESTMLDSVCRPVRVSTRFGEATIARTDIAYDGYGRVVERSVDPAVGGGDGMPRVAERFAYDPGSRPESPSAITLLPERDGSTTLTKSYVDGWGRTLKTVRCAQGSAAGGTGLDAVYPCRSDTEVVIETRYDGATGDVAEAIGPYRPGDQAQPSHLFTYDEFGRMVVDEQPDGTSLGYAYGLGQRTVTDSIGRETTVTFDTLSEDLEVAGHYRGGTRRDAFGRVTDTLDAAGSRTDIYYDGYNRKREERLPEVSVLASGAATGVNQRPTTSYAYDDGDRLVSRTDANGHTHTFSHDALDRLLTSRGPDSELLERRTYVDGGWGSRLVRIRDARLAVEREEHQDGLGRVWKQVAFDGTETLTDYDSRGRAWRQTLPWGEVQTSEVHDAGLRTVETSTQGDLVAAITTTLDARGQPLTITDADGQVLSYAYDLMGRLVHARQGSLETEHRRYDRVGRAISVRASGVTTCFGYDQLDNVVTEELGCEEKVLPRGPRALVTLTRTYTERGQVATETDGAGNVIASEYDALGRLLAVKVSGRDGAAKGTQRFRYDAIGNQTEAVDELGHSLRTAYDDYDRPILSDPPHQGPTSTAYTVASNSWVATATSPTGEVVSTSTDAMGRQVRACGADGVCIQDVYIDGLLASRIRIGAGTPAPILSTRYFQYHPASARSWREWDWITPAEGRRCGGAVPDDCELPHVEHTFTPAGRAATFRDTQGNLTTYSYDIANGSLLPTRVSRDGLPEQAYDYDKTYPILARRSLIDPSGGTTMTEDTEWDRNLRPATILRANGSRQETMEFRYDAAGRQTLARLVQPNGTVAIRESFDPHGRPLSRTYQIVTARGSHAGTLGFSWRDNGQLAGVSFPSGNEVTYDYDKSTGRLLSIVAGSATLFEAQRFDASGRALSLRLDGGAIDVARAYDEAGREQERRIKGIASDVRQETYVYDSHGRLQSIAAIEGRVATSTVYGYDPRDRLISETHTGRDGATRSFSYGYDPATGLRTSKADSDGVTTTTTNYTYTSGNRLASVDTTPIAWDGYGRQTGDAQGRTFRWGLADQLLAIGTGSVNLETNWHDVAGLRVARNSAAGMEFFLAGPGGELLQRVGGDAAGTVDYVRLPGGAVVATIDQKGAVTPVLNSITGSPYRIGALAAKELRYENTSGFGEVIEAQGKLDEPLSFHQMLASEAEGILIAGVRPYDVTAGRFLSADPLELAAAPSPIDAADFFRYARNNPVAMQDANGLAACWHTAEGGCGTVPGEESYEQQRQAHMDHYASERADQARVAHDRFVAAWNQAAKRGENPFDLLPRTSDGADAEAVRSTEARTPSQMEASSEPVVETQRICFGEGCGQGATASSSGTGTDIATSVHAVAGGEDRVKEGSSQEGVEGAPLLADAYGPLQRGLGPRLDLPTDLQTSAGTPAELDLASAFGPEGRGIGLDLRPRVDPYGPFGDDALAEAPRRTAQDQVDDFLRPLEEVWLGIHSPIKDDWLNRFLGRRWGSAYGTISFGISSGAGFGPGIGQIVGKGVYHDIACFTCPGDWVKNWYLYETESSRMGFWGSFGGGIDFGYSTHASFLGTSQGPGFEGEFGPASSLAFNVDPNAQPLTGPIVPIFRLFKVTGWQINLGVGLGGGVNFMHQTQTSKIPYSRIQPYVTAPQRAWQWATGP